MSILNTKRIKVIIVKSGACLNPVGSTISLLLINYDGAYILQLHTFGLIFHIHHQLNWV